MLWYMYTVHLPSPPFPSSPFPSLPFPTPSPLPLPSPPPPSPLDFNPSTAVRPQLTLCSVQTQRGPLTVATSPNTSASGGLRRKRQRLRQRFVHCSLRIIPTPLSRASCPLQPRYSFTCNQVGSTLWRKRCVCVCVCVCARARACVRVRACIRACVCVT